MNSADVDEVAHLLTTLIRGNRFNEGLLATASEEGLLHRILARITFLAGGRVSQAGDVADA